MPRPTKTQQKFKRLKELFAAVSDVIRGVEMKGKAGTPGRSRGTVSAYRLRTESPSRDRDIFAYVQEVLASSPRIHRVIEKLAQDASVDENGADLGWSLMMRVEPLDDSEDARKVSRELTRTFQRITDQFIKRTKLGYMTEAVLEKAMQAGDCMAELGISLDPATGFGRIEEIRELPTWQIHAETNDAGRIIGYKQVGPVDDKKGPVWVYPAQIVHWKAKPCHYMPYGVSKLMPLRVRWEQFKLLEMDLFAAIHSRAVRPEVHYIGRAQSFGEVSDEAIDAYKQKLIDDPSDINRYYVVKEGLTKIQVLEGDSEAVAALGEQHRRMEADFMEALGDESGSGQSDVANRHQASVKQGSYARTINSIRRIFTYPLDKPIRIEFALNGYDIEDPEKYGVAAITPVFRWPDLSETRTQTSTRLGKEFDLGIRSLASVLYGLGEQDPDAEIARMLEERERGIQPLGSTGFASPNGEQGKGVPAPPGEAGDEETQAGKNRQDPGNEEEET